MQEGRREDRTKHQRIADELRWEIEHGKYGVGQRIPTQQELGEEYGVSRTTVQAALGILVADGMIETKQGSGSTVLASDGRTRSRRPASDREIAPVAKGSPMVFLKPHLEAAFSAPQVTLDLFTLTAESLDTMVRTQVDRIMDEEIPPPESISLRLMVSGLDIDLAVPRAIDPQHHDRVLQRQRALIRRHAGSMCDALRDLKYRRLVPEVRVEARSVPFTPTMKLYLLNLSEAFVGPYIVDPRMIGLGGKDVEILDVQGVGATLIRSVRDSDPKSRDSIEVTRWQLWFDSYWNHLARPETFGDLT